MLQRVSGERAVGPGGEPGAPDAALPPRRVLGGAVLLAVGLPLLLAGLVARRGDLAYATCVLLVLALVVLVAVVGGVRVGLPAALAGALGLNWYLTPPYGTWHVDDADQLVVLVAFVAVAAGVSGAVGRAARLTDEAARARAEAQAVSALAGQALAEHSTLVGVLEQVRRRTGAREVALLERDDAGTWHEVETAREHARTGVGRHGGEAELEVPAKGGAQLVVRGGPLVATDRRVLEQLADVAATALEGRRLAQHAARAEAADSTRTALLAAVGHDLRTPLAGVLAAVTSLQAHDVQWTPAQTAEFLAQIKDSADRLQRLVDDLLDASRLQAGVLSARSAPFGLGDAVDRALLGLGWPERVHLDVPDDLPDACADEGLTERVVANVLENALRYSPGGTIVTVRVRPRAQALVLEVVDHGPGLPPGAWPRAALAFRRLAGAREGGLGLGLSVATGFARAMGADLQPRETPGGGLTVRLTLPAAPVAHGAP